VIHEDDRRWPYLSPSREGWAWVPGQRGLIRRLLTVEFGRDIPTKDRTTVVLDVLAGMDHAIRAINDDVLLLVAEAHSRGASWEDIAHRLGRSKQTVHQRFQAQIHTKRTRESLLADLARAEQRARHICHHSTDRDEIAIANAFLRQRAGPRR
jgi:hypothetical protein